jgi:hypothetical protein
MNDELPAGIPAPASSLKPILMNILSIFFLALACLCPALSLMIYAAPDSALNPLPPGGRATAVVLPTSTDTPILQFPPTWTPTPTVEAKATSTRPPAGTAGPTDTLVYNNPNPQGTPKEFVPFVVEGGNPTYSASPEGCSWLGVAGVVYDLSRAPVNNLIVSVHGLLSGDTLDLEQLTGEPSDGQNGDFILQLAEQPVLSLNSLSIQLFDGNRTPLSEKIVFNTYAACDKNLITVTFIQVNP